MQLLPDEIILHIFSFSSPSVHRILSQVCTTYYHSSFYTDICSALLAWRIRNYIFKMIEGKEIKPALQQKHDKNIAIEEEVKEMTINESNTNNTGRVSIQAQQLIDFVHILTHPIHRNNKLLPSQDSPIHSLPTSFYSLLSNYHLLHVDLSRLQFIDDVTCRMLTVMPSLQILRLASCARITDAGVAHLATIQTLTYLSVAQNQHVTGEHIYKLQNLEGLDLSECTRLKKKPLQQCAELKKLKVLDLSHCHGGLSEFLPSLRNHPSLLDFDFSHNDSYAPSFYSCNDGLVEMLPIQTLQRLQLRQLKDLTDSGMKKIGQCQQLTSLFLPGCENIINGLEHIATLTGMKELSLAHCLSITDECLKLLSGLTNLVQLSLSGINCSLETIFSLVENFTLLEELNLSDLSRVQVNNITEGQQAVSEWNQLAQHSNIEEQKENWEDQLEQQSKQDQTSIIHVELPLSRLSRLTRLRTLDISANRGVNDHALQQLANCVINMNQLSYINLCFTEAITDDGMETLITALFSRPNYNSTASSEDSSFDVELELVMCEQLTQEKIQEWCSKYRLKCS